MNKSGLILLISAIAIALVFTWLNTYWLSYGGLQIKKNVKKIDYYLSDFTLLSTHPDGEMQYLITAQHLIHQQSSGKSEIFKPHLQAIDHDGTLINLQAQKANQEKTNGIITLMGNVSIDKNSSETTSGFQIETSDLTYNPLKRSIFTKAAISLQSDSGLLQGIGLSSKLDEQELRIHSNVHAEFTPAN